MSTPSQYLTSRPQPLRPIATPLSGFDPMFGYNPFLPAGQNMYLASDPYPDYSVLMAQRTAQQQSMFQQAAQLRALSAFSGVNLEDLRPNEWTPDEAVRQTSLALAKLATVNPELAQRLAERRAVAPDQTDGFVSDLAGVVGDVVKGGVGMFGKLLEVVAGTSYIVPNMFYDAIDGGDFDFVQNLTGGFSGERKHNWNSVFQEMGWEGDGFEGFLRATVGLGLDIATDPLTWLTFGAAPVTARAGTAARTALKSAPELIEMASKIRGVGPEEAAQWIDDVWRQVTDLAPTNFARLGGNTPVMPADILETVMAREGIRFNTEVEKFLARAGEVVDVVYNSTRTGQISKLLKQGSITLSDGSTVSITEEMFQKLIRTGRMSLNRADWSFAKEVASVFPGLRFRFAVPFSDFRYLSPVLPYTENIGRVANTSRAFFAGQSGMARLVTLIERGDADWDALQFWMVNGWEAFAKKYPNIIGKLKGWNHFGGMMYSASEQAGKLTAKFSSELALSRTGYVGYLSHGLARRVTESTTAFLTRNAFEGTTKDGEPIARAEFMRMVKEAGIGFSELKTELTDDELLDMVRYMELPEGAVTATTAEQAKGELYRAWVQPLRERRSLGVEEFRGKPIDELISAQEARIEQSLELLDRVPQNRKDIANNFRELQRQARISKGKLGQGLETIEADFSSVGRIPESQAPEFLYGREVDYGIYSDPANPALFVHSDSTAANIESSLMGGVEQHVRSHMFGEGVMLHAKPQAAESIEGATRVVARVARPFMVDVSANAENQNLKQLVEWIDEIQQLSRQAVNAADPQNADLVGILENAMQVEKVSKLMSAKLRQMGYDAIAFRNGDVVERVLIFDPGNAKVLDNAASPVVKVRGYFPRILRREVREFVRGVIDRSAGVPLWSVPELESYLSRRTVDMTFEEADAFVREALRERYVDGIIDPALRAQAAAQLDELSRIFDINPLNVHFQYMQNLGMAIGSEIAEDGLRRLINLQRVAPALFSNPVRGNTYEFLVDPRIIKAVQKIDKKMGMRAEAMAVRLGKLTETQHKAASELMNEADDVLNGIVHGLADGETSYNRAVIAIRRWAQLHGDVFRYMDKAREQIRTHLQDLENERELHRKARERAADFTIRMPDGTEAVMHPRPEAGVRVTVLDEATNSVEVAGWHGAYERVIYKEDGSGITYTKTEEGSMSVAEQRAAGKAEGSFENWVTGGVHAGSYNAARERVLLQLQTAPRADRPLVYGTRDIVARDGSIVYKGVPPVKVVVVDTKTGEKTERFLTAVRLNGKRAEDATITQEVMKTIDPTKKRGARFKVESITDATVADIEASGIRVAYADDYIYPVVFEGRVPVLPGVDVKLPGESEMNLLFTGGMRTTRTEGAGNLPRPYTKAELEEYMGKPYKYGQSPRELMDEGYDGIVYTNAVEDAGSIAFVAVRPSAVRQTNVDEALQELARDGRLYVDADGNFLNQKGQLMRGGRAKKLRPLEDIENDLNDLRSQTELLDEAAKELDSLRGRGTAAIGAVIGDRDKLMSAATKVGEAIERISTKTGNKYAKWARAIQKAQMMLKRAESAYSAIYAEAQGAVAKMGPVLVKQEGTVGAMRGMAALTVPGLEGYAAPAAIAQEMNRLFNVKDVNGVRKLWREFILGPWKRWATYRWPGFHIRNLMGAWFNNLLGGVENVDYVFAERMRPSSDWFLKPIQDDDWERMALRTMFPDTLRGKVTYEQLANYLADDGLTHGTTLTVMLAKDSVNDLRETVGLPRAAAGRVRSSARAYDDYWRRTGDGVEQLFRLAAWSRGMARTQGDRMAARAWVMVRHGDYADLTDAEQVIRDMVPFYKWMRTNIPYQIRSMIEQPGVYTGLTQKSEQYFAEAQGIDYQSQLQLMPQWMREAYTIPVPDAVDKLLSRIPGADYLFGGGAKRNEGMKFLMLDLPYKDLYMGLSDYMSAGFPVIRNIVESYGFGQQMFSGRPLTGEFIKADGWIQPFLPVIAGMGKAIGANWVAQGADGTWYIQDRFENVLTAWPVYSKFRNWVLDSPDEDRYVKRMSVLTSSLLGFSVRPGDYTAAELDFYYNEVLPLLDQYRSLGVQFPTAQDFASAEAGTAFGLTQNSWSPIADDSGVVTGFQSN